MKLCVTVGGKPAHGYTRLVSALFDATGSDVSPLDYEAYVRFWLGDQKKYNPVVSAVDAAVRQLLGDSYGVVDEPARMPASIAYVLGVSDGTHTCSDGFVPAKNAKLVAVHNKLKEE